MQVIVKGQAKAYNKKGKAITGDKLKKLDGIDCQDEFTEYMDTNDCSAKECLSSGYLEFKYEDGKLWSITTYTSTRPLTKEELDQLIDYTTGQWSDGIGEGFEQEGCNHEEDTISAWFGGQKAIAFNVE